MPSLSGCCSPEKIQNKYTWRKFKDEMPKVNQKIQVKGLNGYNDELPFEATYDGEGLAGEKYSLTIHDHQKWRPVKMKLNKYRWREMEHYKPRLRERIHMYFKYDTDEFFLTGEYHGVCEDSDMFLFLPRNQGNEYSIWTIGKTKWRKMCKLPGEK